MQSSKNVLELEKNPIQLKQTLQSLIKNQILQKNFIARLQTENKKL